MGYNSKNSVNIDSFLYSDDEVDKLCDDGIISRNYCIDCASKNTKPLYFISHSFSVNDLEFIFGSVVGDLSGKILLDVGSRFGAVLYMGYEYSDAVKLIGVEYNSHFSKIQQEIIQEYNMTDRIEIRHSDIRNEEQLLSEADVVILHNVFDFFESIEEQQKLWPFLRNAIRKTGTLIVASPQLEDCFKNAKVPLTVMNGWVKKVKVDYPPNMEKDSDFDFSDIHLYKVL